MNRKGKVFYKEKLVGIITESHDGYRFIYDPEWKRKGFPIGFNFPLTQDVYYSAEFFPFWKGYLSEGWLREIQLRMGKIDESDDFGLLLANGGDLAGAFTVQDATS